MKLAMRLLGAVHFRCLNARATLLTVQKALRLFDVFVEFGLLLLLEQTLEDEMGPKCRRVRAPARHPR